MTDWWSVKVVNQVSDIQQLFLYQLIQKTLVMLLPFVLVGSFSQLISVIVLNPDSFLDTVLTLPKALIENEALRAFFTGLTQLTIGLVAVLAAFGAAKYTAKQYQKDDQLAGLTAIIALLMLAYRFEVPETLAFNHKLLGVGGLFIGFLVGVVTGQLFRWLGRPAHLIGPASQQAWQRALGSLKPISIMVVSMAMISLSLNWWAVSVVPDQLILHLQKLEATQGRLGFTLGLTFLAEGLTFLGLTNMPTLAQFGRDSTMASANLKYVLTHHTAWHVPYPNTLGTLFEPYGALGGTGAVLALIIAIFLFSQRTDQQIVGRWALIPALFNFSSIGLVGVPLIANIVYLVPFLLVPLVNMLIAAAFVSWHLMPAVVYAVPVGTPSLLHAFVGTDGNLVALCVSLLNVMVGVLIYRPFVRLADQVAAEINRREGCLNENETD